MPHLRRAFRRAQTRHHIPIPHLRCRRFPGYHALFTLCHSQLQASLHELRSSCASLSHWLRIPACKAEHVSPIPFGQSRLFPCRTTSPTVACQPLRGHMRPPSRPPDKAGITPVPSVSHCITRISRQHLPPRLRLIRLSLTGIRNPAIRISASLAFSAGRIVKEQILASRCHPLCRGRPSSVGVRDTSDERNANG